MQISFFLVAAMMLIAMIYILKDDLHAQRIVRAGDAHKIVPAVKLVDSVRKEYANNGPNRVNIKNLKPMFVKGNSMRDYNITDGQTIYVEKFNQAQKTTINTFPVLVLELPKKNILFRMFLSQLKLRKFVGYINNLERVNWEDVYDEKAQRIKLEKNEFVQLINRKIEEMKKKKEYIPQCQYALSETYDEDMDCYSYSLHLVSKIYGKVRFAA